MKLQELPRGNWSEISLAESLRHAPNESRRLRKKKDPSCLVICSGAFCPRHDGVSQGEEGAEGLKTK